MGAGASEGLAVDDALIRHASVGLRGQEGSFMTALGALELDLGDLKFRHNTLG